MPNFTIANKIELANPHANLDVLYGPYNSLSEAKATEMIIMGFVEPFTKKLPMEYAVELNRLISFEMTDSIG